MGFSTPADLEIFDIATRPQHKGGEKRTAWAKENGYILLGGIAPCPHGLYLMASCPLEIPCYAAYGVLDHSKWWAPISGVAQGVRPFLLAHNYDGVDDDDVAALIAGHPLSRHHYLDSTGDDDHWYHSDAKPLRLEISSELAATPLDQALYGVMGLDGPPSFPSWLAARGA